jgi:hypothetical protein
VKYTNEIYALQKLLTDRRYSLAVDENDLREFQPLEQAFPCLKCPRKVPSIVTRTSNDPVEKFMLAHIFEQLCNVDCGLSTLVTVLRLVG